MKKILLYNSGGGLGDSIQLFSLILSLQNHYKKAELFYLGAHSNHFKGQLKDLSIKNIEIIKKDTYNRKNNFFSSRRSKKNNQDYGRNISVIMLK